MFACRTMIGSSAYSCFGMRQRVIYFSFSKMVVNAHRVYLEAYIYFTVVAIIGLVFPTIATFVPGQEGANYKFVGVYFQWVCLGEHARSGRGAVLFCGQRVMAPTCPLGVLFHPIRLLDAQDPARGASLQRLPRQHPDLRNHC